MERGREGKEGLDKGESRVPWRILEGKNGGKFCSRKLEGLREKSDAKSVRREFRNLAIALLGLIAVQTPKSVQTPVQRNMYLTG